MASLVQSINYGDMNKKYFTTMGYYVIKFFSGVYTIQEENTCDRQISTDGKIFVKAHYLICMKEKTNCYW